MRSIFLTCCLTLLSVIINAQSAKITSFSITLPPNKPGNLNTNGFRCEPFTGGGADNPSIRVDMQFHFSRTSNVDVLVDFADGTRPRTAVLMRVSLVDVDRDEILRSVIIEMPHSSGQERSETFFVGGRSRRCQLWFQDIWEEDINGMRRYITGTHMTWAGSLATVYGSKAVPEEQAPKPQPKRRFRVD